MDFITTVLATMLFSFFGIISILLVKLIYDISGNGREKSNMYIIRIDQAGNPKIRRYRGNVRQWNDTSTNGKIN